MGSAVYLDRPAEDSDAADWDAYLHLRDNPAGATRELWRHENGCGAWLVVERDTLTHAIAGSRLASEVTR